MVQLPTFDVTAAQAQNLQTAFGSQANYLTWLRDAIRTEVRSRKAQTLRAQQDADLETQAKAAADAVLPEA